MFFFFSLICKREDLFFFKMQKYPILNTHVICPSSIITFFYYFFIADYEQNKKKNYKSRIKQRNIAKSRGQDITKNRYQFLFIFYFLRNIERYLDSCKYSINIFIMLIYKFFKHFVEFYN